MRIDTVKTAVYTIQELKEKYPEGYQKALEDHCTYIHENGLDCWQDEIFDSLKSLVEHSGYALQDWSLSLYSYSYIQLDTLDCDNLSGKRAFSWLENNVLGSLRISWTSPDRAQYREYINHYPTRQVWFNAYTPDNVPPCPLTGYYADDEYLSALYSSIRAGKTVRESVLALASTWQAIIQREYDWQTSEEYFVEECTAKELEFTANGDIY